MKIILDCEPNAMGEALNLAFKVQAQNPDQKVGNGGAVKARAMGVDFVVIRNQDSYTVRGR